MFAAFPGRVRSPACRLVAVLTLLCSAGCGAKTYPVQGKLVWPDASPVQELAGGTVVFESTERPVSASGEIQFDGTFRLSTHQADDGAPAGRYRVLVQQPLEESMDRPPPRIIHRRFESLETSGLTATVEPKKNEIIFTLERAPARKGKR